MLAAKQFLKAGFEISARREIGRLGEDFDFAATRADETVNVEVTALTAEEPSEATIWNALNWKRRQLPKVAPAILYCVIPERWSRAPINWDEYLQRIAIRFLRGTKTINVVIFWMEQHINLGAPPGAALLLIRKPYVNKTPRHPIRDIGFIFSGQRSEVGRKAIATGVGLESLEKASYDSEFFRWVDHLVPPKEA
jgi:hypothetical protein